MTVRYVQPSSQGRGAEREPGSISSTLSLHCFEFLSHLNLLLELDVLSRVAAVGIKQLTERKANHLLHPKGRTSSAQGSEIRKGDHYTHADSKCQKVELRVRRHTGMLSQAFLPCTMSSMPAASIQTLG